MTRVFVSGCYDILHAGHIEFFKAALRFGDHLTVCFAGDEVYRAWKGREPALPEDSRRAILEELRCVDLVVMSRMVEQIKLKPWLDFLDTFDALRPQVLATTNDDAHIGEKRIICSALGIELRNVPKATRYTRISTTEIRERLAK